MFFVQFGPKHSYANISTVSVLRAVLVNERPNFHLQFAIYPLELVRTRLAVCPVGTYSGMSDCFAKILAQEGHRAFYRGLLPSLVGPLHLHCPQQQWVQLEQYWSIAMYELD
ncbi:MAG: solute carrier family 25 protein [Sphingobacteriales bacterium]|nr:MAG: solute carrier family 25 protein [Sphingobacteriales bacterium]